MQTRCAAQHMATARRCNVVILMYVVLVAALRNSYLAPWLLARHADPLVLSFDRSEQIIALPHNEAYSKSVEPSCARSVSVRQVSGAHWGTQHGNPL